MKPTKYIKRVADGKGGWKYFYKDDQAKKPVKQKGRFSSYPASDDPGSLSEKDFIPMRKYIEQIRSEYIAQGKSSRHTPISQNLGLKVGQWKIDEINGLFGREISQLREIDFNDLEHSEDLVDKNIEGRGDDSVRYSEWIKEGKTPPPIEVVETPDGRLKITDGHRRAKAFKLAGKKVLAWVSPVVDSPRGKDASGRQMKTGITYELAKKKSDNTLEKARRDNPGVFKEYTPRQLRDAIEIEMKECNDIKKASDTAMRNLRMNPNHYSAQTEAMAKNKLADAINKLKGVL